MLSFLTFFQGNTIIKHHNNAMVGSLHLWIEHYKNDKKGIEMYELCFYVSWDEVTMNLK